MKTLVIDGNIWGRGPSKSPISSKASLCTVQADGVERQCCIEILGRSLGRSSRGAGAVDAYEQIAELAGLPRDFQWREFYVVNDEHSAPDSHIAEGLRPLFRDIGYELKFINVPGVDGCPLEAPE